MATKKNATKKSTAKKAVETPVVETTEAAVEAQAATETVNAETPKAEPAAEEVKAAPAVETQTTETTETAAEEPAATETVNVETPKAEPAAEEAKAEPAFDRNAALKAALDAGTVEAAIHFIEEAAKAGHHRMVTSSDGNTKLYGVVLGENSKTKEVIFGETVTVIDDNLITYEFQEVEIVGKNKSNKRVAALKLFGLTGDFICEMRDPDDAARRFSNYKIDDKHHALVTVSAVGPKGNQKYYAEVLITNYDPRLPEDAPATAKMENEIKAEETAAPVTDDVERVADEDEVLVDEVVEEFEEITKKQEKSIKKHLSKTKKRVLLIAGITIGVLALAGAIVYTVYRVKSNG